MEGDEGFFEFNVLGFALIIKNVKELQNKDGINARSEKGVYKIMAPDGSIIKDDIVGYNNAYNIYREETEKYKETLEKEFNNKIQ